MARFRISHPAQSDLARILEESAERWGTDANRRNAAALTAALRNIAAAPQGPITRPRDELSRGLRSLHVRYAGVARAKVRMPVHVIYYRVGPHQVIDVVRVLHQRMDPGRHFPHAARTGRARQTPRTGFRTPG